MEDKRAVWMLRGLASGVLGFVAVIASLVWLHWANSNATIIASKLGPALLGVMGFCMLLWAGLVFITRLLSPKE